MSIPPPDYQADDHRNVVSIFDYTREQIQSVRHDFEKRLDHESRYRQQYGQMAADATAALGENGWVKLMMNSMADDIAELKKGVGRVYLMAFGLLISTLSLLLTVIFGILTRGG